MRKQEVNIGDRFGRLTVLEILPSETRYILLRCLCDCGTECVKRKSHVMGGSTKSCGCYQKETVKERMTTHGLSNSAVYHSWRNMLDRCENHNHTEYARYGARGIKVCDRWHTFSGFWADMGDTYRDGLSIDRIDVCGDYFPGNCRWATRLEQANNKRNTFFVTLDDETHSLADWCRMRNLNYQAVHARIRYGWDIEKALSTPIRRCRR